MRLRAFLPALTLGSVLLAACGQPVTNEQVVADAPAASIAVIPTNAPTATSVPTEIPTTPPTSVPTEIPTTPPTSVPTEVPTVAPMVAPTVAPEVVSADVNDMPQLSEQSVSAAADVPVAATVKPSQPVRLTIPKIKLDLKPVSVGLDKNRVPIVPKHDVGWYNLSSMPGQGENIVFWGHVLRFKATPKIPAPFARVKELKVGDLLVLTTAKGEEVRYKVTKAVQVTPDQVKYILPTGKEQVTLVSCIGDNVISKGEVTKKYRLVTIAEPVK